MTETTAATHTPSYVSEAHALYPESNDLANALSEALTDDEHNAEGTPRWTGLLSELPETSVRKIVDHAPTYWANKAAREAQDALDNLPPTAAAALHDVEGRISAGDPTVTPAVLAAARAAATAEAEYAALAAADEKARAKADAALTKRQDAAKTAVLQQLPTIPEELETILDALRTQFDRLAGEIRDGYVAQINTAKKTLTEGGIVELPYMGGDDNVDWEWHGLAGQAAVTIAGTMYSTDAINARITEFATHTAKAVNKRLVS